MQVEVKANSFTDMIGLDNPEPSQLISFHYDSIRPVVLGFGVNRTITPYLDKFQLAETEFWVTFDEVSWWTLESGGSASPPPGCCRAAVVAAVGSRDHVALGPGGSSLPPPPPPPHPHHPTPHHPTQQPFFGFGPSQINVTNGYAVNVRFLPNRREFRFFVVATSDDFVAVQIPEVREHPHDLVRPCSLGRVHGCLSLGLPVLASHPTCTLQHDLAFPPHPPQHSIVDQAGNGNLPSSVISFIYDGTNPTASIAVTLPRYVSKSALAAATYVPECVAPLTPYFNPPPQAT